MKLVYSYFTKLFSAMANDPGWPAKREGQESGKGRKNNPPAPGRTPPPPPKPAPKPAPKKR